MRSFSFVHVLLLLVFLLAYQCTQAQDYAVTVRGDTLRGKVRIFNSGADRKVQVQSEGKKKESIPLVQTRMIMLEDEVYHPHKGPGGYAYMKLVKEGFLSIYAFQQENQLSYDGLLLAKRDGTSIEVPNLNFKKVMKRFLGDCPWIDNLLESGDYGRRDLEEIVDSYNSCRDGVPVVPDLPSPVTEPVTPAATTGELDDLETKVRNHADLPGKQDALDMIAEIRNKVRRGEKVPNFLVEGLKSSLRETTLGNDVEEALSEIR